MNKSLGLALMLLLAGALPAGAQDLVGLKDLVEQARQQVEDTRTNRTDDAPIERVPDSEINCPQKFAALERVIIGRDPASFRRKGTLLARASTSIPTVNEEELLKRRYALYQGERASDHPVYSDEYLAFAEAGMSAVRSDAAATLARNRWPGFGWWVLLALTLATIVLWRKGYLTREDPVL